MLAKMRTIGEAIAAIRDADPQTAFTQTALRRMIKTGEVPSVRVGTKYLVNLDTLVDYLSNPTVQSPKITTINGIRSVPEKLNKQIYN
jgi:excisionase family DNA binding protein